MPFVAVAVPLRRNEPLDLCFKMHSFTRSPGPPLWGCSPMPSKRALAMAVTAASSLVLSSPACLSRLSVSCPPSLSHLCPQRQVSLSTRSPTLSASPDARRRGVAFNGQGKQLSSSSPPCVPRGSPLAPSLSSAQRRFSDVSFVASFSRDGRFAPGLWAGAHAPADGAFLGVSGSLFLPRFSSLHHLSPCRSSSSAVTRFRGASDLPFISSTSASCRLLLSRSRETHRSLPSSDASLDSQRESRTAKKPCLPLAASLHAFFASESPSPVSSSSPLYPSLFPWPSFSFSPLFLRSTLLLAVAPFLAYCFSLSEKQRMSRGGGGPARCDEKTSSPQSSSRLADVSASFFRSWGVRPQSAEAPSASPLGKEGCEAAAVRVSSGPSAASLWGSGEGGGILRWRGGGVGRWSEAANAEIEDRSLAVLLAIDGEEEREDDRSAEPSADGDTRQETEEEAIQLASLVFPREVAALLGGKRVFEEVSWMRERKAKMRRKQGAPNSAERKKKPPQQKVLLTAVIDGHGGPQVAEYVMQNLPWHVERELTALRRAFLKKSNMGENGEASLTDTSWLTNELLTKAISRAFRTLDDEIYQSVSRAYRLGFHRSIRVGACCTAILVTDRSLVVANSGDCKAVLSRRYGAELQALNEQLNANSPAERQRLREEHPDEENVVVCKHSWQEQRKPSSVVDIPLYFAGLLGSSTFYSGCYVKGRLQPTRAFGDFLLKRSEYGHELQRSRRSNGSSPSQPLSYPYLTVDPVVAHFDLRGDEDFVVLGSDGVWDFLDDSETARAIHASLQRTRQRAARAMSGQSSSLSGGLPEQGSDPCQLAAPNRAGVTSLFSADAARLAAADLVKTVLQRAADERAISVDEMRAQEPKQRRRTYDDTTAVVVLLGQDWRPRPAATKERR
uniref:Protein phosphatase 2C domain-containing protein n=1 Tax=Toxoplasma gondii COUG TaxID=1074873 RepID=A0A2G8YD99_TOXGO|nr:protein phosphatase 2C domain-containing protein [Toxoplasma gondii COUG]